MLRSVISQTARAIPTNATGSPINAPRAMALPILAAGVNPFSSAVVSDINDNLTGRRGVWRNHLVGVELHCLHRDQERELDRVKHAGDDIADPE